MFFYLFIFLLCKEITYPYVPLSPPFSFFLSLSFPLLPLILKPYEAEASERKAAYKAQLQAYQLKAQAAASHPQSSGGGDQGPTMTGPTADSAALPTASGDVLDGGLPPST